MPVQPFLSRRSFLRLLALTAVAGALPACSNTPTTTTGTETGSTAPVMNMTLKTSGWPVDVLFKEPKPGSREAGYNKALQQWLSANPGVKLEQIEFNPWSADALRTAIAGGTAPFCYPIGVLGSWNVPGIQAANAEGLFADITDVFERQQIANLLDPKVLESKSRWQTSDGRIFGIPYEIVSSEGFFFNREHLAEIGIDEIPMSWTWDDLREIAARLTKGNRKGLAMAAYVLDWILPTYGIDFNGLVSTYPVPGRSFNWRWDFTTFVDDIEEGVNLWRKMYFEDKSVYSDPNFWDFSQNGQLAAAFYEGTASMTPGIHLFFSDMATKMGKTITQADEFMGFVSQPYGPRGYSYQLPFAVSAWAFNPDLKPEELDRAVALFAYLHLGEGFVTTLQEIYNTTNDAGEVVRAVRWPYTNRYSEQVPGIPVPLSQAAGPRFAQALQRIFSRPKPPELGEYIPAEVNRGPGDTPWYDKISRWAFSQDQIDVKAEAIEMENILNQQAKTFPSSVDETAFADGIRRYYADVGVFLQTHAPQFYEQRFKPFYDLRIKPNFG